MDEDTAVSNLKENSPNLNERIIFALELSLNVAPSSFFYPVGQQPMSQGI